MTCTCAGTAPGYPQHESFCGQPDPVEPAPYEEGDRVRVLHDGGARGTCLGDFTVAEVLGPDDEGRWTLLLDGLDYPVRVFSSGRDLHGYVEPSPK